jgi:hypothetical protein
MPGVAGCFTPFSMTIGDAVNGLVSEYAITLAELALARRAVTIRIHMLGGL